MRSNARLPKLLGKKIKILRRRAGLTQEELAYRIHVSRAYVGYIEQARNTPSLETLNKIAKCLGVSLSELVDFRK